MSTSLTHLQEAETKLSEAQQELDQMDQKLQEKNFPQLAQSIHTLKEELKTLKHQLGEVSPEDFANVGSEKPGEHHSLLKEVIAHLIRAEEHLMSALFHPVIRPHHIAAEKAPANYARMNPLNRL